MKTYFALLFLANILFGQNNFYIISRKQMELSKVFIEAQKKLADNNGVKLNVKRKAIYGAHLDAKK